MTKKKKKKGAEPFRGSLHAALECLGRVRVKRVDFLQVFRMLRRCHD